jgi:type IV pilus assembly protein PilM
MGWLTRFLKGAGYLYPALDIGTSSVKLVQTEKKGNNFELKAYGSLEYKEQVFAGSEIIEEQELINTIRNLFGSLNIDDDRVIIHIPLNACLYNVITIPSDKNPESAVIDYVRSLLSPNELNQVKIDYRILPISIEKGFVDIAIAAVKQDALKSRISVLKQLILYENTGLICSGSVQIHH